MVSVAPNFFASSRRESSRSIAISLPQPISRALTRWQKPSGPMPTMAEDAVTARDVGRGHDPVARAERPTFAVGYRVRAADGLDHADVLMTADEWVRDFALVVCARVLLRFASVRVLVGATDARVGDLH